MDSMSTVEHQQPELVKAPIPEVVKGALPDIEFSGNRGKCNLCNVVFSSPANAMQHSLGKRHKRCRQRLEARQWLLENGHEQLPNDSASECDKPNSPSPQCSVTSTVSHGGSETQRTSSGELLRIMDTPPDSSYTKWYVCRICMKRVNSAKQLQAHLGSHRDRVRKQSLPAEKRVRLVQSHVSTAMEISQKASSTKIIDVPQTVEPSEKRSRLHYFAGTMWHTCETCNKKLNTASQLQIHMQSHRKLIDVSSVDDDTIVKHVEERPLICKAPRRTMNADPAHASRVFDMTNISDVIVIRKGEKLVNVVATSRSQSSIELPV